MIRLLITLFALVASAAQAETLTAKADSSFLTGDYLLQVVGSLFLVIFALLVVVLLLRRFNTVGTSSGSYIQVLASAPVGQRERAVLLQVGTEQILVGVASGSVTTLHQFSDPVAPADRETTLSFKEVWNLTRNKQGVEK